MAFTYSVNSNGPNKYVVVYENGKQIFSGTQSFSASENDLIQEAITGLKDSYPGVENMTPTTTNTTTKKATTTNTTTVKEIFNSPNTDDIQKTKEELHSKINELQEIGLPSVKDVTKTLWTNVIEPKLLSPRQVAKKFLIIQGSNYEIPITEEDAQLFIYGKVYYKNGKLYDNDLKDPNCVALPGDEDYAPPIDENHPLWQKITGMVKELKDGLLQLGIKLGEFVFSIPNAIATIAVSLIALVSSAVILPFGAGIPTALSAVQTMIATIKTLQAKTSELLPLLGIIDTISLLLPKESQSVVAQINVILGIIMTVLASLVAILGLLDKILSKLGAAKNKMDNQKLKATSSSDPETINAGETSTLTASATGSDWDFTYEWTDSNGNVISRESEISVTPFSTTKYYCKVTDSKGTVKSSSTTVKVN